VDAYSFAGLAETLRGATSLEALSLTCLSNRDGPKAIDTTAFEPLRALRRLSLIVHRVDRALLAPLGRLIELNVHAGDLQPGALQDLRNLERLSIGGGAARRLVRLRAADVKAPGRSVEVLWLEAHRVRPPRCRRDDEGDDGALARREHLQKAAHLIEVDECLPRLRAPCYPGRS
jgi:hypothetical protein